MSYSRQFFEGQQSGSLESARIVVPLLMDLVHPKSVLDIGCGVGTWLSVFSDQGVSEILGIDGDYVPTDMLKIPKDCFTPADLRNPVELDRRFDLATSFEVGEHLPESSSEALVRSLTDRAPVVAFSAAIPLQGGTDHINEQWQSFWCELFAARGFVACDAVRPKVWHNHDVAFWYAQNMLVYVKEDMLGDYPALQQARQDTVGAMLDLVHPALLHHRNEYPIQPTIDLLTWAARRSLGKVKRAIKGK